MTSGVRYSQHGPLGPSQVRVRGISCSLLVTNMKSGKPGHGEQTDSGAEPVWRGLVLLVASAFMFSVMGVLVKHTGRRLPTEELILGRSTVALLLVWMTMRAVGVNPWGQRRRLLLLRGVFGFSAMACFFYALTHMPLADATVIFYTGPIFTALLASVVLGERVEAGLLVAAGVSLAGIAVIAQPEFLVGGRSSIAILAVGAAFAGALLAACSWVSVRALTRTEHPAVIVFYVPLLGTPLIALAAIPRFVWPTALECAALVGIGASAHTARIWFTRGIAIYTAGQASTINSYLQVAFAVLWGMVLFAEVPDRYTLAGVGLILTTIGALAVRKARSVRRPARDRNTTGDSS